LLQSSAVTVVVTSRVLVSVEVTVETSVTTWLLVMVLVSVEVIVSVTVSVSVTPGSVTVEVPMYSVVVETGPGVVIVDVTVGPSSVTVVRSVVVAVHELIVETTVSVSVSVVVDPAMLLLPVVTVAVQAVIISVMVAEPVPSPSIVTVTVAVGQTGLKILSLAAWLQFFNMSDSPVSHSERRWRMVTMVAAVVVRSSIAPFWVTMAVAIVSIDVDVCGVSMAGTSPEFVLGPGVGTGATGRRGCKGRKHLQQGRRESRKIGVRWHGRIRNYSIRSIIIRSTKSTGKIE
jgi:hypothetical protein